MFKYIAIVIASIVLGAGATMVYTNETQEPEQETPLSVETIEEVQEVLGIEEDQLETDPVLVEEEPEPVVKPVVKVQPKPEPGPVVEPVLTYEPNLDIVNWEPEPLYTYVEGEKVYLTHYHNLITEIYDKCVENAEVYNRIERQVHEELFETPGSCYQENREVVCNIAKERSWDDYLYNSTSRLSECEMTRSDNLGQLDDTLKRMEWWREVDIALYDSLNIFLPNNPQYWSLVDPEEIKHKALLEENLEKTVGRVVIETYGER